MAAYALPALEAVARWYAVYVRSRHEKVVELGFRGKGYPAFSPAYRARRKRADRTMEVDVPLFPGYVFCQFDVNRRLPILTTPGVVLVVSAGESPQPVEDHEIASLQSVIASGRQVQPWPFLKQGHKVRIQAGPLAGAFGMFLRTKNDSRLIVSVTLLQRSVSVELEKDSVAPEF